MHRLRWLLIAMQTSTMLICALALPDAEKAALQELQASLELSESQVAQLRWNSSVSPCTSDCDMSTCPWAGIACRNGHVVKLDLSDHTVKALGSVKGLLPNDLTWLTQLSSVDLSGHSITGSLPSSWANLTSLTDLDVSNNALSGSLPSEWAGMQALVNMNLSKNALYGSLPASWLAMPSLRTVDLRGNPTCIAGAASGPGSLSILYDAKNANCLLIETFAAQAPNVSPSPTPTPSSTPASSLTNQNNAPILQMSTGINIAVSVVIGAFLLFGIIAGIFRVKRQQRAHQRWVTHRMMTLRQREAQEEAAFRELIQKIIPPSVMLDPVGEEFGVLSPVAVENEMARSPSRGSGEFEAIGGGSTVIASGTSSQSNRPPSSVNVNHQRGMQSGGVAGTVERIGDIPRASPSSVVPVASAEGPSSAADAGTQFPFSTDRSTGQQPFGRHRKVPLFTVDVYISQKGSLTFQEHVVPPLDSFRLSPGVPQIPRSLRAPEFVTIDLGSSVQVDEPGSRNTSSREKRIELPKVSTAQHASFPAEPLPQNSSDSAGLAQIEARRRERIDRLRDRSGAEVRRGERPPEALIRWPAFRRLFGMETLEARDQRLSHQADRQAEFMQREDERGSSVRQSYEEVRQPSITSSRQPR